jgi:uncharacterized cupin superfamily protein
MTTHTLRDPLKDQTQVMNHLVKPHGRRRSSTIPPNSNALAEITSVTGTLESGVWSAPPGTTRLTAHQLYKLRHVLRCEDKNHSLPLLNHFLSGL